MKKIVLNPSCSELVTNLNITDIDEIKSTLKTIVKVTGYQIGFISDSKISQFPLDPNRKTYKNSYVANIDEIVVDQDEIGIKKSNLSSSIITKHVPKWHINDKIIPVILFNPNNLNIYLYINLKDGYCYNEGLTVQCTQHCCSSEFPVFAEIIETFGSYYHAHDGGSTGDFEDWCNDNNKEHLMRDSSE